MPMCVVVPWGPKRDRQTQKPFRRQNFKSRVSNTPWPHVKTTAFFPFLHKKPKEKPGLLLDGNRVCVMKLSVQGAAQQQPSLCYPHASRVRQARHDSLVALDASAGRGWAVKGSGNLFLCFRLSGRSISCRIPIGSALSNVLFSVRGHEICQVHFEL